MWHGDFPVGPHAVGFRMDTLTRASQEGQREITLSVWYPAESDGSGEPMEVGDYFRAAVREGQLSESEGLDYGPAFAAVMTGSSTALSADEAEAALHTPVGARFGATGAGGTHSVVLWSSRHATGLAQAPLSEVLASHGFLTASAWSSEPPLTFLWEDRPVEEKLRTIEAHTADLKAALDHLRGSLDVDSDNVVVLAWSYGGQTAARLQELDDGVRGVIGLDANVLPARPEESLDLRRPLVFLIGRETGGRGFAQLENLTAPWISLRFPDLAHGGFNAMEGYLPEVLGADTVFSWSQMGPVVREGYRALVRVSVRAAQGLAADEGAAPADLASALRDAAAVPVEVASGGLSNRP